jgi:hypothetical protein
MPHDEPKEHKRQGDSIGQSLIYASKMIEQLQPRAYQTKDDLVGFSDKEPQWHDDAGL